MSSYVKVALVIVCAGIAVASYQTFGVNGREIDANSLSFMLGRALAIIILPIAIAVPWSFKRGRSGGPVGVGPVVAGIATLLVMSFMSTYGIKADQGEQTPAAADYEYRGKGCDLAVNFPGTPKITQNKLVGTSVVSEQAELDLGDVLLRAECIPVRMPGQHTESAVATAVGNFATANGFENATVTTDHDAVSVSATMRGNKVITGKEATYEVRMIATEKATLSVVTGGAATGYPQSEIVAFQRSVHSVGAQ